MKRRHDFKISFWLSCPCDWTCTHIFFLHLILGYGCMNLSQIFCLVLHGSSPSISGLRFIWWSDLQGQLKARALRRCFVTFWELIVFIAKWHWSCANLSLLMQTENKVRNCSGVIDVFPKWVLFKTQTHLAPSSFPLDF